ncbi:SdpI family protein [Clostridium neonatale]|uniref:SdpI family protein n=1 Tax=Clostridium neonatale TaxID=137838 RepID=UPI003D34C071
MTINIYIPIIFIIIGFLLSKYPPKHRNYVLGYKSPIFMRNKNAWYEGNRFFGETIMYGGIIGVILYFLVPKTLIPESVFPIVYVFIALICIIYTEIHLYRLFRNKTLSKKD